VGSRLGGLSVAANKSCGLASDQEGAQSHSREGFADFSQLVVSIAYAAVDESSIFMRSYAAVAHVADCVLSREPENACQYVGQYLVGEAEERREG